MAEAGLEPVILLSQPPRYWDYRCAPSHLAFIFGFETGFHKVAESLAKLLRLALNLQSSCLSLPSTGIIGMHHHTRLQRGFWKGKHFVF